MCIYNKQEADCVTNVLGGAAAHRATQSVAGSLTYETQNKSNNTQQHKFANTKVSINILVRAAQHFLKVGSSLENSCVVDEPRNTAIAMRLPTRAVYNALYC